MRLTGILPYLLGAILAPKVCLAYDHRIPLPTESSRIPLLGVDDSVRFSITAFGGRYDLSLTRVPPKTPRLSLANGTESSARAEAVLFKGIVKRRSYEQRPRRVAAYIAGGRLQISFISRRSRPIKISIKLADLEKHASARAAAAPPNLSLRCGTASHAATSSAVMSASAPISAAAYAPARVLEISTEADYELYQAFGSDTNAEIQGILNAAETVYWGELGVEFALVAQNVFTTPSQPYTSSVSDTLLQQFAGYTNSHNHLGAADVYHLFTGKDLESSVVGIAYVGTVCAYPSSSYGLSQANLALPDYIVAAHEIGHTLNALHDDTPNSIMNAAVSPACTTFSRTSRRQISSYIDNQGYCLSLSPTRSSVANLKFIPLSSSRNGQFSAVLGSMAQGQTCTVKLFATARKSDFYDRVDYDTSPAVLVASRAVAHGSSANLSVRFRRGGSPRLRTIYFAAESECPDSSSAHSVIKTLTVRGYGVSGNAQTFITNLQAGLSPSCGGALLCATDVGSF